MEFIVSYELIPYVLRILGLGSHTKNLIFRANINSHTNLIHFSKTVTTTSAASGGSSSSGTSRRTSADRYRCSMTVHFRFLGRKERSNCRTGTADHEPAQRSCC